jgi:hypothetical protein
MCAEIKYHTDKRNKDHGVTRFKQGLGWVAWAFEYMNDKYDPLGINLKGWSDHIELTKDNYTETFEELYEKYKGSGRKVEPEMKLLFLIGLSAMTFHGAKSAAKIPGLEEVISKNPALAAKLEEAISKKMMNDVHQKSAEEIRKEAEYKAYQQMLAHKKDTEAQVQAQAHKNNTHEENLINFPQGINTRSSPTNFSTNLSTVIERATNDIQQPIIKPPPNIQNILNKIKPMQVSLTKHMKDDSDTTPMVSSVRANTRVEVTDTMNQSDTVSTLGSIKSEDVHITKTNRARPKITV